MAEREKFAELNMDELLKELEDLYDRLVLDYNDHIPFEQTEEDRLAVGNVIDILLLLKD